MAAAVAGVAVDLVAVVADAKAEVIAAAEEAVVVREEVAVATEEVEEAVVVVSEIFLEEAVKIEAVAASAKVEAAIENADLKHHSYIK